MNIKETEAIIQNIIDQGIAKKTGLYVFDTFENFILNDDNKFLIEDITELYIFYLNQLDMLDKLKPAFLRTLKQEEIKRNQVLENINPFLVQVFMNSRHRSATNFAIKEKKEGIDSTLHSLCRMHKILLDGVQPSMVNESCLRTNNTIFVGNNKNDISYIPIDHQEIPEALNKLLTYYNQKEFTTKEELFTNPIIVHGILAALQCFKDGNTRLARILEHINLWNFTPQLTDIKDLESPAVYISEAIMVMGKRNEYRELIKNIAIDPNNKSFNAWIKFNLLLIEKQIHLNQDKIKDCFQILQKTK